MWQMQHTVRQTDTLEHITGTFAFLGRGKLRNGERQHDIFQRVQVRDQVVRLKDETEVLSPEVGLLLLREAVDIYIINMNSSGRRTGQPTQDA